MGKKEKKKTFAKLYSYLDNQSVIINLKRIIRFVARILMTRQYIYPHTRP